MPFASINCTNPRTNPFWNFFDFFFWLYCNENKLKFIVKQGWVKILIKPNMTTLFDPDQAFCTQVYIKEVTIPTVMYVKITEHSFPIPHMLSLSYKYHIYGGQSEQYLGWDEIQINSMFRNGECFIMSVASASYT